MKNFIAVAASVAVNFAVLGALDWSALAGADRRRRARCYVTQLPIDADLAAYASAARARPAADAAVRCRLGLEAGEQERWLHHSPSTAATPRQRSQPFAMSVTSRPSFSIARSSVVVQGRPQLRRM